MPFTALVGKPAEDEAARRAVTYEALLHQAAKTCVEEHSREFVTTLDGHKAHVGVLVERAKEIHRRTLRLLLAGGVLVLGDIVVHFIH
jgi:hypothetical protein